MCLNQRGDISIQNSSSLKLEDKFTYLGSGVSSTETDINTRLAKAWTAIDWLLVIQKSDLTDKMKQFFFQATVVSILPYGWTTRTLTKRMEKNLDGKYTRLLRAILNRSWRQHSTKQQQYGHLLLITKTIQDKRTRHARHCWRSSDELISDVLQWTSLHGRTKTGRPAGNYIQQLCADTGCSLENLRKVMDDKGGSGRWSGRSMLIARHDDDGEICLLGWLVRFYGISTLVDYSSIGWGCRIHRLHIYRRVRLPQRVSWYDSKKSDGEAPVMLELWGMRSTPLLPSLPGSLWLEVVARDRVLCIGQIEVNCNYTKLNWLK